MGNAVQRLARLLLIGPVLLAAPAAALGVEFVRPAAGEAVFGMVTVELRLDDAGAGARVELSVDGRFVGARETPPWRFEVDVGGDNREHRFEAVVRTASGETARSALVTSRIRVDEEVELDLRQVYVTVVDRSGRRVADLPQSAFRLWDEGAEQRLVTFSGGDVPFTAVLLIDASGSMEGERLEVALGGARAFLDGLAEFDEAKLIVFSDRLRVATPFSGDPAALRPSLDDAAAGHGTAVLDHLYLALAELEKRQGRRVIVLLSDGWDPHSVLQPRDVERLARVSQAMVYWVRLDADRSLDRAPVDLAGELEVVRLPLSAWRGRKEFERRRRTIRSVVEQSGGRVDTIAGVEEVEASFRDILRELREQYALGYYPGSPRDDGSWRKVRVEIAGEGLRPRMRKGYLDRRRP